MRRALIAAGLFAFAACSGAAHPGPDPDKPPDPAALCEPGGCGPALGMPSQQCSDGSIGGNTGRCLREPDGACGWEIRECPAAPTDCITTGCSGTVCAEAAHDVVTTCELRPEYACYRDATCERQPDGACGWTPTSELTACLAHPPPP